MTLQGHGKPELPQALGTLIIMNLGCVLFYSLFLTTIPSMDWSELISAIWCDISCETRSEKVQYQNQIRVFLRNRAN